jgi:hypothetical protein
VSEIVWSSPVDGATNVPTNADLWVLLTGGSPSRVFRGGVALPRHSLGHGFDLGELAPNTTYRIDVEFRLPDIERGEGPAYPVTFTTGDGPSAPDPGADPGALELSSFVDPLDIDFDSPTLCDDAVLAQGCFDAGESTFFVATPTGSAALGWIIESEQNGTHLWPGSCGAPRLFLWASPAPCIRLHGIDAAGGLHSGSAECFPGVSPPPRPSTPLPDIVGYIEASPAPAEPEPFGFTGEAPGPREGVLGSVGGDDPSASHDGGCSVVRVTRPASVLASGLALALALVGSRARRRPSAR